MKYPDLLWNTFLYKNSLAFITFIFPEFKQNMKDLDYFCLKDELRVPFGYIKRKSQTNSNEKVNVQVQPTYTRNGWKSSSLKVKKNIQWHLDTDLRSNTMKMRRSETVCRFRKMPGFYPRTDKFPTILLPFFFPPLFYIVLLHFPLRVITFFYGMHMYIVIFLNVFIPWFFI